MLTVGQHKTLKFIRGYIKRHGYSPTLNEIASGRGLSSKGSMHREVRVLADAGYIKLAPGRKRSIQLPDDNSVSASRALPQVMSQVMSQAMPQVISQAPPTILPLLGRIAAGKPIEAITDQETVNLTDFVMGRNRYCLLVTGDSMVGAGILDGDTVIIESCETANKDDIVVALIDNDEVTLKRFRNRGDGFIELIPENPGMSTMVYAAQRVAIQGVVAGVLRTYNYGYNSTYNNTYNNSYKYKHR